MLVGWKLVIRPEDHAKFLILLLLAVMTYYLSVLLFAIRWKFVLKGLGHDVSLVDCIKGVFVGLFFNNITPTSRGGGEIARALLLKLKHGIPVDESITSIIYERLLEFLPVFGMFLVSMNYLALKFPNIKLFVYLLGACGFLLWLNFDKIIDRILKYLKKAPSSTNLKDLKRNSHVNIIGIITSSLVWALDIARFKLIFWALSFSLPLKKIIVISLANLILSLLAFTPGGVGIIEGGLTSFLIIIGLPTGIAIRTVLIERFISYILGTLTGGIITFLEGGLTVWRALKSH
ncbi:lysylphosphatidylglycerol synthase transmembrane domain-containing protein [Pyrococcus sp. ST04]|uniref:lysylphosphatidylglycerol synthase transmembrane domain-containing protein n=1 Tax=Pyrococcus sp. ST04 TaxID=1183377 RepID=UPI0002605C74|nr:lysylphosphatidylglycerol synthase transmembrane domain-containing protein [Pyrococcus sp. ST04]AFK22364.1 hypothetical protein Py04_0763 [Pyrococcus sp. ST04]